jgi:hypothetical protein
MGKVLTRIEAGLRRRLRERYDRTRTSNRVKLEFIWDSLLFYRTFKERRAKLKIHGTKKVSGIINKEHGFGLLNILDKDYVEKVQELAVMRRDLAQKNIVGKSNSKEYLQQIFDISEVTQENIFFLDGILQEDIIGEVSTYFGRKLPILHEASVFYSPKRATIEEQFEGSQLFHRDGEGTKNLKIWILCEETNLENGPTVLLDATTSEAIAREIHYIPGEKVLDQAVELTKKYKDAKKFMAIGAKGTVFYTDTCRSFHYGSRTSDSASRLVAMFHFVENNSTYYFPYISRTFTSRLKPLNSDVQAWAKKNPLAQALLSKRILYSR